MLPELTEKAYAMTAKHKIQPYQNECITKSANSTVETLNQSFRSENARNAAKGLNHQVHRPFVVCVPEK